MDIKIEPNQVYLPSEDVVARKIDDAFLLVPIASGIGNMEDELYTLNETGQTIWNEMAPGKTVSDMASELAKEYDAPENEILADIQGILSELLKMKMIYPEG